MVRGLIQRVHQAAVRVDQEVVGEIGTGLCLFLGIRQGDGLQEAQWLAEKVLGLRVFSDDQGRLNRSLVEIGGDLLVVSQFTLYGDCRRGRRPSFTEAAAGPEAEELYQVFVELCQQKVRVQTGVFGADMDVSLVNHGPVTLWVEKERGV